MKKIIYILLCLSVFSYAQKQEKQVSVRLDTSLYEPIIGISYFGEQGLHPGLKFSYEVPNKRIIKEKTRARYIAPSKTYYKKKVKTRSYVGNFASYIHLNNQISFLPSFTYQRKVENKYGLTRGMGIGMGLAFNYFLNPTYTVQTGELERVLLAHRTYLTIPFHLELGLNLERLFKVNHAIALRAGTHILLNYNAAFLPIIHSEIAYQFPITW